MPAKIRILSDICIIFVSWTYVNFNVIRKALKIFWLTIVAIAALLFTVALLIQLPQVQTYVSKKVVESLDDKLNGDIEFDKIHLRPFRTLVLRNVRITDRAPRPDPKGLTPTVDTFFVADYISATFTYKGLLKSNSLHLDKVVVSNAQMNLVLENHTLPPDSTSTDNNLSRIFRLVKKKPQRNEKEIFNIKDVYIENMGFSMKNHSDNDIPFYGGINWSDLDVKDIWLTTRDLKFKGGIMYGFAESLKFREKSGYRVEKMSGNAKVGRGKAIITNLLIDDPWSEVHLPLYMMSFNDIKDFQDFIGKVKLDAEIADSRLDFKTLTYFAPQLEGNELKLRISGKASGYVDNFNIINLKAESLAGGFTGTINGSLTGLPEIEDTRINASVRGFKMTCEGLGKFLSVWNPDSDIDLSRYAKGQTMLVDATAKGLINSMDISAKISSQIGEIQADISTDNIIDTEKPIHLKGTAATKDLDVGKIISSDIVGPVTLRTGLEASLSEAPNIKVDSLFIDRLNFNQYDYKEIKAVATLSEDNLNGTMTLSDPNLRGILQGGFAISSKTQNARYKIFAHISDANLYALNIDKRGKSKIRFTTNANFTRTGKGNILGKIDLGDIYFENSDSLNYIGNINLTSDSNDDIYKIRLRSQFADVTFTGTAPITEFIRDLRDITVQKEIPSLFKTEAAPWRGNSYSFDFVTHNSMNLLAFIMPGAYIHKDSKIRMNIDRDGKLTASMNSKRLAIGSNYIKDVNMTADNLNNRFSGEITSKDFTVAGLTIENNHMKFLADNDHLGASYSFDNQSELDTRGELVMNAAFERTGGLLGMDLNLLPSAVYLNAKEWRINPSNIKMKDKDFTVNSFEIVSGDERIYAYGSASQTKKEILTLSLDRFDISILNPLLGPDLGIRGAATGNVQLTSPMNSIGLLADMLIDSTFVADEPLGIVKVGSAWNEDFKRFDIMLQNDLRGKKNIDAFAKYTPKSRMFDGVITLDKLPVKYAEPFLTDVFSELGGSISGRITAEGPVNLLEINSYDTRLEDALLKIDYTNVPYFANGPFEFNDRGVYFNDIRIKDRYNGTGTVNGSINWDRFKDISFDTRVKVNAIEGVDLTKDMNEDFYGNIFGTGNVSITGPVSSLVLSVDAVTAKTGQLHIPMNSSATSSGATDLLKFKEFKKYTYVDPYEAMRARMAIKESSSSDLYVKLRVDASPNVDVFVELDEVGGNVLSGRGNGLIELEAGEDLFNIKGDYTLTGGNYNFSALGIVNREFEIKDGSSINFSGDILASTLNIDATYITKTSLGALLADENAVSNRRTVECGIKITDKLSNPRLTFSINIPDLNPMVKSRVESALSTEDKVQKQFLSLLLSNSFLPDEQSGIVNNSSMLYSNVSEAMANQLSNILHKLNIPLDLGLNYQPTEQGTDLFDVAVSTQLFNNRVVVNGNIGNKEYSTGNTQNDVVGDLDIEIKLTRSGALRLNLFSHSADLYSNYLDNSQRNGVGLTYQTEFNNIGQFFKTLFAGKKKRQEAKLAEEQAAIKGEKVEMKITKEEK